jgi:hypothetical protein
VADPISQLRTTPTSNGGGAGGIVVFGGMIALILGLQLAVYWPAWRGLPAGDDFGTPIAEIKRGDLEGPLALVTQSPQARYYRPVQSLLTWAVGQWNPDEPWAALHLAVFVCLALYLGVFLLLLQAAPLTRGGQAVAAAVFLWHPVLPAQVASVDGLSSLLAPTIMWLGVGLVHRFRDRLWIGLPLGLVMLVLGAAIKEYAFGIVPLATLAVLCLREQRRWRAAVVTGLVLGTALLAWMLARQLAMPAEAQLGGESLSVLGFVRNTSLFLAALLSFANTVTVYVQRSPGAIVLFAASWLVTVSLLLVGLVRQWRASAGPSSGEPSASTRDVRSWMVFGVLAIFGAMFPASLLARTVSEMYMAGQVLPLALVAGLAAQGWARLENRTLRRVALLLLLGQLGLGLSTVHAKVAAMVEVGERAQVELDQIVAHVPPEARDWRIALVFPPSAAAGRFYGVYHMQDMGVVGQKGVEWRRYGMGHRVYYVVAQMDMDRRYHARQVIGPFNEPAHERVSPALVNGAWLRGERLFDVTLVWDPPTRRFTLLHSDPASTTR